jgi:hypothetical protein
MFAVPEQELRLFIGTVRRPVSVLFEASEEVPGAVVRLWSVPRGAVEYTLSVAPGRRGTAKASVRVKHAVSRAQEADLEQKLRYDIKRWLSRVRAVVEGRAPRPAARMAAELRQACMVRPRITGAHCTSASIVIRADPVTVWDAVHSPETRLPGRLSSAISSGYVPGTPHGEAGEMQYFLDRRDDGQLAATVVVVTEISGQRSALTHALGHLIETRYMLTPESESGPTRLDLSYRWSAPQRTDAVETVKSQLAVMAEQTVGGYKSVIENPGSP